MYRKPSIRASTNGRFTKICSPPNTPDSKMTFDYSSETPPRQFVPPPSLLSWVRLRSGQVKLFNFRVRLSDLWQYADSIPQHRPKQHVVCLHHFDQPMIRTKFGRAYQTGDNGKWRHCFPTRRCADQAPPFHRRRCRRTSSTGRHSSCSPPLVRLQSVSEIPVGFEFVRGHGRQGAVPRRKVMRGGKDRCGTERDGPERGRPGSPSCSGLHEGLIAPSVQSTAEGRGERRCSNSPLIIQ
jgi:hypothetical protein